MVLTKARWLKRDFPVHGDGFARFQALNFGISGSEIRGPKNAGSRGCRETASACGADKQQSPGSPPSSPPRQFSGNYRQQFPQHYSRHLPQHPNFTRQCPLASRVSSLASKARDSTGNFRPRKVNFSAWHLAIPYTTNPCPTFGRLR